MRILGLLGSTSSKDRATSEGQLIRQEMRQQPRFCILISSTEIWRFLQDFHQSGRCERGFDASVGIKPASTAQLLVSSSYIFCRQSSSEKPCWRTTRYAVTMVLCRRFALLLSAFLSLAGGLHVPVPAARRLSTLASTTADSAKESAAVAKPEQIEDLFDWNKQVGFCRSIRGCASRVRSFISSGLSRPLNPHDPAVPTRRFSWFLFSSSFRKPTQA